MANSESESDTELSSATSVDGLFKNAYEAARDENIRKNQEILLSLGLITRKKENENKGKENKSKPKVSQKRQKPILREGSRRSKRLRNEPAEIRLNDTESEKGNENKKVSVLDENQIIRIKIERLKKLHLENGTAYTNPTATYDHTWMRVRTMSDKALIRRVNVIEKVLILAGKNEIAEKAKESLNRLLALLGDTHVK